MRSTSRRVPENVAAAGFVAVHSVSTPCTLASDGDGSVGVRERNADPASVCTV